MRGTASPTVRPCRRCRASPDSVKTRRPPPTHGRGCLPFLATTCSNRSSDRQGSHERTQVYSGGSAPCPCGDVVCQRDEVVHCLVNRNAGFGAVAWILSCPA